MVCVYICTCYRKSITVWCNIAGDLLLGQSFKTPTHGQVLKTSEMLFTVHASVYTACCVCVCVCACMRACVFVCMSTSAHNYDMYTYLFQLICYFWLWHYVCNGKSFLIIITVVTFVRILS